MDFTHLPVLQITKKANCPEVKNFQQTQMADFKANHLKFSMLGTEFPKAFEPDDVSDASGVVRRT